MEYSTVIIPAGGKVRCSCCIETVKKTNSLLCLSYSLGSHTVMWCYGCYLLQIMSPAGCLNQSMSLKWKNGLQLGGAHQSSIRPYSWEYLEKEGRKLTLVTTNVLQLPEQKIQTHFTQTRINTQSLAHAFMIAKNVGTNGVNAGWRGWDGAASEDRISKTKVMLKMNGYISGKTTGSREETGDPTAARNHVTQSCHSTEVRLGTQQRRKRKKEAATVKKEQNNRKYFIHLKELVLFFFSIWLWNVNIKGRCQAARVQWRHNWSKVICFSVLTVTKLTVPGKVWSFPNT